ncbi:MULTISPECIES: UDP-3-O-acyl-N-acetylglucosamine deacetylase [Dictyoglomus]|jgi:UDP-3-O-[3-hydroxymyristoyl] N-acetylglucosamine deacetylase|uniref:UDP-3-O-acyl-N-acetylglucosamine deacetylase n=1 Tax=Dictyoglomus turgidum (strain DSM 6724 / Z-1310) TaxID=515635 RepID=B8E018_DICTD|nr:MULTISPECIES: UDP-3-O-acyl-N-acetylglucosamine deacetylase [Dictyoglomus]ACK42101.1 UDP-3-0-acyl N-acetylglucosamine deacetylase [Dictyoglomus turgidum DSM 6724]HBU32332.1 UDP-3-O-[3-hydroxymyristoyl] N-acetylglucosamine deacetylase [Dictyoglomus sp.]
MGRDKEAEKNLRRQATIDKPFTVEGKGLHTGGISKVTFVPAPSDTGIVFIKEGVRIPALYNYVSDTKRRVILKNKDKSVSTVEHLLSAIYALGISNLFIYIEGEEIPILDGSALKWCELLESAGIKIQDTRRRTFYLKENLVVRSNNSLLLLFPSNRFEVLCVISFPKSFIKWQRFYLESLDKYFTEIAPARTFGFYYEVKDLIEKGLISGADLESALLIGEEWYVNSPRFWDEPVRHKILDIIGDFSLLGIDLKMKIISIGSGHSLHVKALEILTDKIEGGKGL